MRLALVLALLVPTVARADEAQDLTAQGEQLAKDGHFGEAIAKFKEADKLAPRASHVCLIALAYLRLERWPQAEVFLDRCHAMASDADPLPEWVPVAEQQLAERLAAANVAPVAIAVSPQVPATLAASSFAPGETFAPRTIHMAPGHHTITADAPGYEHAERTIDILDASPRRLVIDLVEKGHARPPPPSRAAPQPSKVPWIVMGAGGALVLAGLGVHLFGLEPVRDKLQQAHDQNDAATYALYSPQFDHRLTATLVLYGAGAVAIAAGAVLRYTVFETEEVSVAVAPTTGGAMLAIGWTR